MLKKIISKNKLLGFNVDAYSLSLRLLKKYKLDFDTSSSLVKSNISTPFEVRSRDKVLWFSVKKHQDLCDILKVCSINGVSSENDIFIVPCKQYDIEDISEDYKISSYWSIKLRNPFVVVSANGSIVGLLDISYIYNDSSSYIHLNMIEVIEKNKGWGSLIVTKLKCEYKYIEALSLLTAKKFWLREGATFDKRDKFYFGLDDYTSGKGN